MTSQIYSCPVCRESIQIIGKSLHCTSCSINFPLVENIPIFYNIDNYYGEINREQMTELIEMAKTSGYQKAISVVIDNPWVQNYVLDENRAKWTHLLPLDSNTKVLDIGCGWGTNTIPIARKVKHVTAIDATLERVKFVQLRADESGLSNISTALASAMALPYPSASFDVVIFNGVLEWLGGDDTKKNPKDIQMQALKEAHRVLAPGGLVYIGIENRFSLRYFLGQVDDHSFIRFTSLMPRWMAQAYFKLRTGNDYFMHTHSLSVYRHMLKNTGFAMENEYHPWPNYRYPVEFAKLNKSGIVKHLSSKINELSFGARQWFYCTLLRWLTSWEGKGFFCHSFLFIYKK